MDSSCMASGPTHPKDTRCPLAFLHSLEGLRPPERIESIDPAELGGEVSNLQLCRSGNVKPERGGAMASSATSSEQADPVVHVLWINAGLSCDGDSVALTAATQPSIEEIALGALPGLPKIAVHWPLIDFECGPVGGADTFMEWWFKAERGELEPFVLVVEGSIPNESIKQRGLLVRLRHRPGTPASRSPPASGSTASRPRPWWCSRSAPARPTAASMPWPATPRAPWECPTTWAGTGSRRPASRSSACRAARSSRTTFPRRSSTSCTRPPARRR